MSINTSAFWLLIICLDVTAGQLINKTLLKSFWGFISVQSISLYWKLFRKIRCILDIFFKEHCSECIYEKQNSFLNIFDWGKLFIIPRLIVGIDSRVLLDNTEYFQSLLICRFEIALQLYWNCTSARVFSCKLAGCFQDSFS